MTDGRAWVNPPRRFAQVARSCRNRPKADYGGTKMELETVSLAEFAKEQRIELYSAFLVPDASGTVWVDSGEYALSGTCLVFVTPFQTLRVESAPARAWRLQFHGDFYCVELHRPEVACNGVLFNNVYSTPVLPLEPAEHARLEALFAEISAELARPEQDHAVLASYLQLFLALATRSKQSALGRVPAALRDELMDRFEALVDKHYLTLHAPAEYAALLGITPAVLAKRSRRHFARTPSQLIQERLVLEAKKLLHLTRRSVKDIAFALHFEDEHYFSRFFKKAAGVSPSEFRQRAGISVVADRA